jgi:DNA adenine methylase
LESLAFTTIIENWVNRGGILANGASFIKNGENGKGITSRWYPETLRRRILAIAQVAN